MVRNTKGGKGSKSLARKLVQTHQVSTSLRVPQNELELFAIVTKMFGPMCEVVTIDGKTMKCHIRGKFKGRSKRNAMILIGSILIVGLREFEAPNFHSCDVLEVFDHDESSRILKMQQYDFHNFASYIHNDSSNTQYLDDELFDNTATNEVVTDSKTVDMYDSSEYTNDVINIDDI